MISSNPEFRNSPEMEYHFPKIIELAKDAKIVIDVGSCSGAGTTRALLRAMENNPSKDKILIGIDHEDQLIDRPLVPYWHFVLGDSRDIETVNKCCKILEDKKNPLFINTPDIIFIDTVHDYEFIKKELPIWNKIAGKNTVWLFHDTWMFGFYNHMTDAIKEFAAENGYMYEDITKESHGLGIMIRKNH